MGLSFLTHLELKKMFNIKFNIKNEIGSRNTIEFSKQTLYQTQKQVPGYRIRESSLMHYADKLLQGTNLSIGIIVNDQTAFGGFTITKQE